MPWLRRLACLSIGGFLLGVPAAPTPAHPLPSPPDIGFRIDWWEAEDGLPESSATAMVQTPDGDLWFGTFNGLVRFDGFRFTVFDHTNTPEFRSAFVIHLHVDRRERLWVSLPDHMLCRENSTWHRYGADHGWPGNYVRSFAEDRAGTVRIGTDRGVARYADGAFAILSATDGLPAGSVHGLAEDPKRPLLWIAVRGAGLACWEQGRARRFGSGIANKSSTSTGRSTGSSSCTLSKPFRAV